MVHTSFTRRAALVAVVCTHTVFGDVRGDVALTRHFLSSLYAVGDADTGPSEAGFGRLWVLTNEMTCVKFLTISMLLTMCYTQ